jgi:hypothetical protein
LFEWELSQRKFVANKWKEHLDYKWRSLMELTLSHGISSLRIDLRVVVSETKPICMKDEEWKVLERKVRSLIWLYLDDSTL